MALCPPSARSEKWPPDPRVSGCSVFPGLQAPPLSLVHRIMMWASNWLLVSRRGIRRTRARADVCRRRALLRGEQMPDLHAPIKIVMSRTTI